MPHRLTPRIIPASPITVAIEEKTRPVVAYGAIADISGNGACVWTDARLDIGRTLRFRISFPSPPEVHEVVGVVVWAQDSLEGMEGGLPALRHRVARGDPRLPSAPSGAGPPGGAPGGQQRPALPEGLAGRRGLALLHALRLRAAGARTARAPAYFPNVRSAFALKPSLRRLADPSSLT